MTENSGHRSYDELFVGGSWRKPANPRQLDVISPHSEEPIGHVQVAGPEDVDAAVAVARQAFDHGPWPRLAHAERMAKIEDLAAIYAGNTDEMADLITDEMGSPRSFSRLGQAGAAAALIHLTLAAAREFPWAERRNGVLGEVHLHRAPVGVVGAIVPWNVPQFLIMPKLIPALIAGCTVIIKPAPETPLDALWLAEMIEQVGLPEGVVSVLPGGTDVGEALVRHPGVDKIAFTGSSAVGRRIATICGEQLKRVSLELGGKSAAIILDDADVGKTVAGLKSAALMNNGQACVAQTRILVSERRHDEVVDALAEMMSALHVGDPTDEATDIGPLFAQRHQRQVQEYIRSGQSQGARMVLGGADSPETTAALRALNTFAFVPPNRDFTNLISDKKISAAVAIPTNFDAAIRAGEPASVTIYIYEGDYKSTIAAQSLDQFFQSHRERIVLQRLTERNLPEKLAAPYEIRRANVVPAVRVSGNLIGMILPYIVIVMCMTGAIYPAID